MEHKNRIRELSDFVKRGNIYYRSLRRRREKGGAENLCEEIIAENISNLGKETGIQIQEAEGTPIKINKSSPYCNSICKI